MALELLAPILAGAAVAALIRSSRRQRPPEPAPALPASAADAPPLTIGDMEEAIRAFEGNPPSMEFALLLHRTAHALGQEGRLLEAERHAARLGELVRELPETSAGDLIGAWEHHAALLRGIGRMADAERVQTRVVELADRFHGSGSLEALRQRVELAAIMNPSRPAEALELLRAALDACERTAANESQVNRHALSRLSREAAGCLFAQGERVDAERGLQLAHRLDLERLGDASAELAPSFEALALLARLRGRPDEARGHLEHALALLENVHGLHHRKVSLMGRELAGLLRDRGHLDDAERLLLRCLAIDESCLGADHLDLVPQLREIAQLHRLQGRVGNAELPLSRALGLLERIAGSDHRDLIGLLNDLAQVLAAQSRHREAEALLRRALDIAKARLGTHSSLLVELLDELARMAQLQTRPEQAETLLAEALRHRESILPANHPELGFRLLGLANLRSSLGRTADAEPLFRQSLDIFIRRFGGEHQNLIGPLYGISGLHFQRGDLEGALEHLERAIAIAETTLAEADPTLLHFVETQAMLLERLGRTAEAEHGRSRATLLRERRRRTAMVN